MSDVKIFKGNGINCNCYLHTDNDYTTLVDFSKSIKKNIKLDNVFGTHGHVDHNRGFGKLNLESIDSIYCSELSGLRFEKNQSYCVIFNNESYWYNQTGGNEEQEFLELFGWPVKNKRLAKTARCFAKDYGYIIDSVKEGSKVGNLLVVELPGHTNDSTGLYEEVTGKLFGGDVIHNYEKESQANSNCNNFTSNHDVSKDSIEKMLNYELNYLGLGHDKPVEGRSNINTKLNVLLDYMNNLEKNIKQLSQEARTLGYIAKKTKGTNLFTVGFGYMQPYACVKSMVKRGELTIQGNKIKA